METSVNIGDGKDWWYVHGLTTHDKVYELNKQMCDIGKTMSDTELMMDDIVRRAEENIRLYNDNNKYARFVRAAYESKFGKPKEKDIMEEKKTKKMTKAEAFEYLKGKKVRVCGREVNNKVQLKIFACGVEWKYHGTDVCYYGDYLVINPEGFLCHCDGMGEDYWNRLFHEEISADDILSIEIVEEDNEDKPKMFSDNVAIIQSQLVDDEVVVITKKNFMTMVVGYEEV